MVPGGGLEPGLFVAIGMPLVVVPEPGLLVSILPVGWMHRIHTYKMFMNKVVHAEHILTFIQTHL